MMFSDSLKDAILQSVVEGSFAESTVEIAEIEEYIKTIELALRANNKLDSKRQLTNYRDNIPFAIPQNWYGIKLKDIALRDITYGIVKLGTTDPSGVKVLRCSDVKEGYIDQSNIRTVKKSLSDQYKRTILNGGEIVVNVRGTLGGFSIVPQELSGYNIAREVAMIDLVDGFNKEYVLLCLMSPYFWKFQNMNLRGIAYKGLNINLLNEFIVPIPPIRIQNEIVNKYRVVSQKLKEYRSYESKLLMLKKNFPNDMRESILQSAMQGNLTKQQSNECKPTHLIDLLKQERAKAGKIPKIEPISSDDYNLPDNWCAVRAGECLGLLDGEKVENVNLPYLEAKYLRGITPPEYKSEGKLVRPGQYVILVDGENSGEVFAIKEDGIMGSTFKLLFTPQCMNEDYLLYFLKYHKMLLRNNKRGAAIPHLNKELFNNLILPIPPLEEQQRIVARLNELLPLCDGLTE